MNAPLVIFCGGKGLRMRDYSDNIPKTLVPIGGIPILESMERLDADIIKNFVKTKYPIFDAF